ncbi:methionyl-tRNA formyltransferase [Parafilimonas sp.]|uniref:methionyl-tRNA formyltransferase n=1 Tax=Parafilimonas sp. TaxID=1969739 RepID=UPI0039E4C051
MSSTKNLRIVFMGTPEFAVASLEALVNAGCNIAGVITAPDKPAGRGMQLQQSAVKKYAVEKNLPVLQPEKLKNPGFIEQLKSLKADVQVVVAFRMLPEIVWNMPPLGTINVHASLLPQYRGAAPVNRAIINGETETGITTFKLQHEIDTGNILMQEKIAIGEKETAGELHDKLKELGASLIVKTIEAIAGGSIREKEQSAISYQLSAIKHAPKLNTDTCKIDWNNTASDIYNLIRGLSPYPAAFTYLDDKVLKIFFAEKETATHNFANGSFHTNNRTYLKFACADGFIHCKDVQLQGKKRMHIEEFLRGYRFN